MGNLEILLTERYVPGHTVKDLILLAASLVLE